MVAQTIMQPSRRLKKWSLAGTACATLAVVFWAIYVFTGVWLRIKSARELAARAEPLPVMVLADEHPSEQDRQAADAINVNNTLYSIGALRFPSLDDGGCLLDGLEELQQPTLRTMCKYLFRGQVPAHEPAHHQGSYVAVPVIRAALQATSGNVDSASTDDIAALAPVADDTAQVAEVAIAADLSPVEVSSGNTGAAIVNLQQATLQLIFRDGASCRAYSVTDCDGETVWLVVCLGSVHPDETGAEEPASHVRVLLVDSSGRVLERLHQPDSIPIGKLSAPLGKADQIVFGPPGSFVTSSGEFLLGGTTTIRIVEGGRMKTMRTIHAPGR